jgi:formylglycine-generating enzyme required for sulfatase activity
LFPPLGDLTGGGDASADALSTLDGGACPGHAGPPGVDVGGFCIDSTEVTIGQYRAFVVAKAGDTSGQPAYCAWNTTWVPTDPGWPRNGDDAKPVGYVDWCDAYGYCQWAGKRLCGRIGGGTLAISEVNQALLDQWFKACSRSDDGNHKFPYGATFDANACNVIEHEAGALLNVATMPGCNGGYTGIYDLVGNTNEWIDSCDGTTGVNDHCVDRGGSYSDPPLVDCKYYYPLSANNTRNQVYEETGFRCCAP